MAAVFETRALFKNPDVTGLVRLDEPEHVRVTPSGQSPPHHEDVLAAAAVEIVVSCPAVKSIIVTAAVDHQPGGAIGMTVSFQ